MVLILGDSLKIQSFSALGCATLALCSFEVPSRYLHRCVLCLLYVPSIPTYLSVLQKYFTFRASPHKRHRRTTLSQSEPISGLEALFRLARSRAPCACASYIDTLLLFIVTIGRTGTNRTHICGPEI